MKKIKQINYLTVFISIVTILSIMLTVSDDYRYLTGVDMINSSAATNVRNYNIDILESMADSDTEYENLDIYEFITGEQAYSTAMDLIKEDLEESYHFVGKGTIRVKAVALGGMTEATIKLEAKITIIKYENGDIFEEVVIYEPAQEYEQTRSFKLFYNKELNNVAIKVTEFAKMSGGELVANYTGAEWEIFDWDTWMKRESSCDVTKPIYILEGNIDNISMLEKTQDPITKETIYPVKLELNNNSTLIYGKLLQEVTRDLENNEYTKIYKSSFTKTTIVMEIGGSGKIKRNISAYDEYDFNTKVLNGTIDAHVYFRSGVNSSDKNTGLIYTMLQAGGTINVERPEIDY